MTLEQQLAKLAELGLPLDPGISIDDLPYSYSRKDYEEAPFSLLLSVLGGEADQEPWDRPICSRAWNFDTVCINTTGDYVRIVKRLCQVAGQPDCLKDVTDFVDVAEGKAWLRYTINGTEKYRPIDVNEDWADVLTLKDVMEDIESEGRRFYFKDYGKIFALFYLDSPTATELNRLSKMGLKVVDRKRLAEHAPRFTLEQFLAWRSPRRVTEHPTRLDNPLWSWLVRTQGWAYRADDPSSIQAVPMWSFCRFGMSTTILPDGRVVYIAGEQEDFYDPQFYIYNDVIVVEPSGEIAIHGYPVKDFPPTDFHSATLVGNSIFIVGCLGYREQRVAGITPVYELALDSMRIRRVKTIGDPPGWIFKHSATLADDGRSLIVSGGNRWASENIDLWSLNIETSEWLRLTKRDWQHWKISRIDGEPSRLSNVREALWDRDHANLGFESGWKYDDSPDFAALELLYRLDERSAPPTKGPGSNEFRTVIDGLTVRFKEDWYVEAIVEGRLEQGRFEELQRRMLALMERLEGCACKNVLVES